MINTIKKLTIELNTDSINLYDSIANDFKSYIYKHITKHIEVLIKKNDLQDILMEIKDVNLSLDIDLPNDVNNSSKYIIKTLERELTTFAAKANDEIRKKIQQSISKKKFEPLPITKYNAIKKFLINGNLEWWIDNDDKTIIRKLYKDISISKKWICELINVMHNNSDAMNRFCSTLSNDDVELTASIVMNIHINEVKTLSHDFFNYIKGHKSFQNLEHNDEEFIKNKFLFFLSVNDQNFTSQELLSYSIAKYDADQNFQFFSKILSKNDINNNHIVNTPELIINNDFQISNESEKKNIQNVYGKILSKISDFQNIIFANNYTEESFENFRLPIELLINIISDLRFLTSAQTHCDNELITNYNDSKINISLRENTKNLNEIIAHNLLKNTTSNNVIAFKNYLIEIILKSNDDVNKINFIYEIITSLNPSYLHIYNGFLVEKSSALSSKKKTTNQNLLASFLQTTLHGIIYNNNILWYQIQVQELINEYDKKQSKFAKSQKNTKGQYITQNIDDKGIIIEDKFEFYNSLDNYFLEESTDYFLQFILSKIFNNTNEYQNLVSYINTYITNNEIDMYKIQNLVSSAIISKYNIKLEDFAKIIEKTNHLLATSNQTNTLNITNINTLVFLLNNSQFFHDIDGLLNSINNYCKSPLMSKASKKKFPNTIKDLDLHSIVSKFSNFELKAFIKKNLSITDEILEVPYEIIEKLFSQNKDIRYKELKNLVWIEFMSLHKNEYKNFFKEKKWEKIISKKIAFEFNLEVDELQKNISNIITTQIRKNHIIPKYNQTKKLNDLYIEYTNKFMTYILDFSTNEQIQIFSKKFLSIFKKNIKIDQLTSINDLGFTKNLFVNQLIKLTNSNLNIPLNIVLNAIDNILSDLDLYLKKSRKEEEIDTKIVTDNIFDIEEKDSNSITFDNTKVFKKVIHNEIINDEEKFLFAKKILAFFTSIIKDVSADTLLGIVENKILNQLDVNDYLKKTKKIWIDNLEKELLELSNVTQIQLNTLLLRIDKYIAKEIIIPIIDTPAISKGYVRNLLPEVNENQFLVKKILAFFTSVIKDVPADTLLGIVENKILNQLNVNDYLDKTKNHWLDELKKELLKLSDVAEMQLDTLLSQVETYVLKEIIIPQIGNDNILKIKKNNIYRKNKTNSLVTKINENQFFAKKILAFFTSIIKDVPADTLLGIVENKILNQLDVNDYLKKTKKFWIDNLEKELLELSNVTQIQLNTLLLRIDKYIAKEIIIPIIGTPAISKGYVRNLLPEVNENQFFAKKILAFFTSVIKDVPADTLLRIVENKILNQLNVNDYLDKTKNHWLDELKKELLKLSDVAEMQLDTLLSQVETYVLREIIIPQIPNDNITNTNDVSDAFWDSQNYPNIIDKSSNAFDLSNSEIEKKNKTYYLNNAAIVFIYPYIEDLYIQFNLLKDNEFKDEISHFNALYITNYLCTNELFAAEWDTVFLKVFLGLKLEEFIYPKYRPKAGGLFKKLLAPTADVLNAIELEIENLEETEKNVFDEIKTLVTKCGNFIFNIINQWESLNNLTKYKHFKNGINVNNFKNYFFSRPCIVQHILETQEPFWHITIPPYEYDSSEILPPWPMDYVTLPWIKEKIVVHWL